MTRTTADPLVAALVQTALHEAELYEGAIDGAWGPKSDLAFEQFAAAARYAKADALTISLTADQQADLAIFLKNWKNPESLARYQAVAVTCDVPAELVAAIHYRECPDFPAFGTYLHNGDPLGEPTTDDPKGLLFQNWDTAAIDAITREHGAFAMSGVTYGYRGLIRLCVFAEYYNGEGYAERGVPDPYVLAGTSGYKAGKFVADGSYDPAAVDAELGVLAILRAIV